MKYGLLKNRLRDIYWWMKGSLVIQPRGGVKRKIRMKNHIRSYGNLTIEAQRNSDLTKSKIDNRGYNNRLSIGNVSITNTRILLYGSNNTVEIKDGARIRDAVIHIGDDNNQLYIGSNFDAGENLKIYILEGTSVKIGADCMFSSDVTLRTSDAHSIYNTDGKRVNGAKNIVVGDHVWFGEKVTCLKGTEIENNVAAGGLSLLTDGKYMENTVYAGVPARKIRDQVSWSQER